MPGSGSALAGTRESPAARFTRSHPHRHFASWLVLIGAAGVLMAIGKKSAPWAFKVPRELRLPARRHVSDAMDWLITSADLGPFTFYELTRGIAWVLNKPLELATGVFATGWMSGQGSNAVQLLAPLSWVAVIASVAALGLYAKNWKLATLAAACFGYLALFGQWQSAMVTLSSISIAVPFGAAGGLAVGIAAYRWTWVRNVVTPLLDLMQTVPVFAYLVPVLFLFGFGPVAAMIATIIYAMPPMIRVTMLALHQVPEEVRELGRMTGCTGLQMLRRVLIPSAVPSLVVGLNQVIMLSLNMVIIASMIGAGGLGYDVLAALRRLDIGAGFEAGLAIVVLAIALDRLSRAFASKAPPVHLEHAPRNLWARHPYMLTTGAVILITAAGGQYFSFLEVYPDTWTLTTGTFWDGLVKNININYFDQLEAFKTFVLLNVLVPFKRLLLSLPWPAVVIAMGLAGLQLGGWRLALLTGGLTLFCALVGLWDKTMITVYLCGVSVLIASLIGIPLGIVAAQYERVGKLVEVLIDTLQTLPSFVYLMPVVMLFRVGDFSAMIAVVVYAMAPAIRYTMHGIRQVDPQLVEAGIVSGCTPWQVLFKVKLKLAIPEIMLGINQTIMLALSMLVITALVGTRDLGQEVYIALTKADTGRGIVAGLCVAFIAIAADRLIAAGARRARTRLGLQ